MTLGKRAVEITEDIEKAIERKLSKEEKKILWRTKLTQDQIRIAKSFLSQNWIPRDFMLKKLPKVLGMTFRIYHGYIKNPILINALIRDSEFEEEMKKDFPISDIEKWFTKEIDYQDVIDHERDLRALAPRTEYILIDVSDFLKKGESFPLKIPEDIMTKILKFFEDNRGNYSNCKLYIEGDLPERKVRRLKKKALKVVKVS